MADRVAVILSRGPSNHPAKRHLEESIVAGLARDARLAVMVIPPLYDLRPDDPVLGTLRALPGDLIVLSWLYPRATHWTFDRYNIRGHLSETALTPGREERQAPSDEDTDPQRSAVHTPRVLDQRPVPPRSIHHLDLRVADDPQAFIEEVQRIAAEVPRPAADSPTGGNGQVHGPTSVGAARVPAAAGHVAAPARRWYPVIDYSRCTNCMECIDFCLFGVYGIDHQETILVEQPDNCRQGCPACSRVCPERAILFPHHKTPVIAGDPGVREDRKIDLSQLFGKPTDLELAARERNAYLRRGAAGAPPGNAPPGNAADSNAADSNAADSNAADSNAADSNAADSNAAGGVRGGPACHDELDELIDELDQLDL